MDINEFTNGFMDEVKASATKSSANFAKLSAEEQAVVTEFVSWLELNGFKTNTIASYKSMVSTVLVKGLSAKEASSDQRSAMKKLDEFLNE